MQTLFYLPSLPVVSFADAICTGQCNACAACRNQHVLASSAVNLKRLAYTPDDSDVREFVFQRMTFIIIRPNFIERQAAVSDLRVTASYDNKLHLAVQMPLASRIASNSAMWSSCACWFSTHNTTTRCTSLCRCP